MAHFTAYWLWISIFFFIGLNACKKAPDPCAPDYAFLESFEAGAFVSSIDQDNPYFPLSRPRVLIYQSLVDEGVETQEIRVTQSFKTILQVRCILVEERVYLNAELREFTRSFFAQDVDGNVWIFGEENNNYDDGRVINQFGSWEAGRDAAQPGYYVHANPEIGDRYHLGYRACDHEDMAENIALKESVTTPYGAFDDCLKIREWSSFEPDSDEYKYFAPGVGLVRSAATDLSELVELIDIQ